MLFELRGWVETADQQVSGGSVHELEAFCMFCKKITAGALLSLCVVGFLDCTVNEQEVTLDVCDVRKLPPDTECFQAYYYPDPEPGVVFPIRELPSLASRPAACVIRRAASANDCSYRRSRLRKCSCALV